MVICSNPPILFPSRKWSRDFVLILGNFIPLLNVEVTILRYSLMKERVGEMQPHSLILYYFVYRRSQLGRGAGDVNNSTLKFRIVDSADDSSFHLGGEG